MQQNKTLAILDILVYPLFTVSLNGLRPIQISLDDYFVDREHTPLDEFGEYDFEALEAIDIEYFNQQLTDLLEGKEIDLPGFDFQTGQLRKEVE